MRKPIICNGLKAIKPYRIECTLKSENKQQPIVEEPEPEPETLDNSLEINPPDQIP